MKRIILSVLFIAVQQNVFAQADSISLRDDMFMTEAGIPDKIFDYASRLDNIVDNTLYPNEIANVINKMVRSDNLERIFFDTNVVVESNLYSFPEISASPMDRKVRDYLDDLNLLNTNGNGFSITITKPQVSTLKKSLYLYYNAYFEIKITSKSPEVKSPPAIKQLAEIRLLRLRSKWYTYINAIRLPAPDYSVKSDTTHRFNTDYFLTSPSDTLSPDEIRRMIKQDQLKNQASEKERINDLLREAEKAFKNNDLDKARSYNNVARDINPADNDIIEQRKLINIAIEETDEIETEKKMVAIRIAKLRRTALDAYEAYDFSLAAQAYDSLSIGYGIIDDTVRQKTGEIAEINSIVKSVQNEIFNRRYTEAIEACEKYLASASSTRLQAECYYQKAFTYFVEDNKNKKKILAALDKAVLTSGNKHSKALMLRSRLYSEDQRLYEALKDASLLIGLFSREPKYYALRGDVYRAGNSKAEAIENYRMAILFGTSDSSVFVYKTILEYETGKFDSAIVTAESVIAKTKCFADAYYYRALAEYELKSFTSAGRDFYSALACGLEKSKADFFHFIATTHFSEGNKFYELKNYAGARAALDRSIALDSNNNALFLRSRLFLEKTKPESDSAEVDLSAIIKHTPDAAAEQVYFNRGNILMEKGNLKRAVDDFNKELYLYSSSGKKYIREVYTRKAEAEKKLNRHGDAANDFEIIGKRFKDDLSLQFAAEEYYKADSVHKIIDVTSAAEDLDTRRPEIFCWRGRAYFCRRNLKKAKDDFEHALLLDKNNGDAEFWTGRILVEQRKFEDAISHLHLGTLFSKEFVADAYYYLGYSKIKSGAENNFVSAVDDLTRALNINSGNYQTAETYSWIAYVHLRLHKDLLAKENLEKAKAKDDRDQIYLFVSGCQNAGISSWDIAFQFLEKALENPKLLKEDIENEPLLKTLQKDKKSKSRFKSILKKAFP